MIMLSVANLISQNSCREVGLIQRPDAWEYPLLIAINHRSSQPIRVEHINVTNPSKIMAENSYYRSFQPCMVVSIGLPLVQQISVHSQIYNAIEWRNTNSSDSMRVFLKR
ncbi:hypothetical protein AB3R30_19565 [Leptolyngbyaceae cyanobacterium UHCC 1019]